MTATKAIRVLGRNDEVTTCECCGRPNLKFTVVLESEDGGEMRYGRDCAARALLGNNKSGSVKRIEMESAAIAYAKAWLNKTAKHTAVVVANAISVRFTACWVVGPFEVDFASGVRVSN